MNVRYRDVEPEGLAALVGGLLEANLRADPRRARLLRPARVEIRAQDAGASVLVELRPDGVLVTGSADGEVDVRVAADAARLVELVAAPLRFGLPDPLRPEGRAVLRSLVRREIRIRGLLRHPLVLTRLARLLSVG
ncbi:MAG: hypothetical protein KatS3mg014_0308 [Actinomycetota bacterium]|nr:MAG: hypothetical protein KatS3mg014_0308 [Actinomycetota bacterium]